MVCKGDVKLCIPEPKMLCRPARGCHHLRSRIDPVDLTLGSNQGSYAQARFSRTRTNIQNGVPITNQPILDKCLRDRRKHLADDLAVLLPERRHATPNIYSLLAGLHKRKYSYFARKSALSYQGESQRR
jgi:hypothetical protein